MIFPRRVIALGSGGESFSPLDLPGDWLLLPASAYTAGLWADQGGNGFDFTQAVGDLQPTAQIANGVPVVRFDGVDDYLSRAAVLDSAGVDATLFVVFSSDETGDAYFFGVSDTATNARRVLCGILSNHLPTITQRNSDTTDTIYGSTSLNDSVWRCAVYMSTGTAFKVYLNGVAEILGVLSGVNNGDWIGDCTSLDVTCIGAWLYSGVYGPLKGDIAYIAYVNRALSDAERTQVEAYLSAECNLGF